MPPHARSILFLIAIFVAIGPVRADEPAAWAALRQGGAVALMRHTDAPGGAGDPPGFRLDECSTQRNLSAKGRADAVAIGQRLRQERVPVGKILSSPWCRCVDTARLLDVGKVAFEPTFGNVVVLSEQRDALTEGARGIIRAWKGPHTLLVVTHGANIQALTGDSPVQGEIVVIEADTEEILREIGRIPPDDG